MSEPREVLERMMRAYHPFWLSYTSREKEKERRALQIALRELVDVDEDGWRNPDDMVNLVLAITELKI